MTREDCYKFVALVVVVTLLAFSLGKFFRSAMPHIEMPVVSLPLIVMVICGFSEWLYGRQK